MIENRHQFGNKLTFDFESADWVPLARPLCASEFLESSLPNSFCGEETSLRLILGTVHNVSYNGASAVCKGIYILVMLKDRTGYQLFHAQILMWHEHYLVQHKINLPSI